MRQRLSRLFLEDEHSKYAIIELHVDGLWSFLAAISRRVLMISSGTGSALDLPQISDVKIFIKPESNVCYIVILFNPNTGEEALSTYLQRIKRKYKLITHLSLPQLDALVSKDSAYPLPGLISIRLCDTDALALWMDCSQNRTDDGEDRSIAS